MVNALRRRPIHQVTVQWCLERENQTSIYRQIPIPEVKRFVRKGYCTVQSSEIGAALIDLVTYETVCSDTLEGLCEYFEILVEGTPHLKTGDVMYSVSPDPEFLMLRETLYSFCFSRMAFLQSNWARSTELT